MENISSEKLSKVDLKNLVLNENAYFYKKSSKISASDIKSIFKDSRVEKNAKSRYKPYIKEQILDANSEKVAEFSLDIFEFRTKPSFLKKVDKNLEETKFGLFLVIETDNYLV